VHDLLRYAEFHLGDGSKDDEQFLTPDSLTRMQTPQATVWKDEEWGLTWSLRRVAGTRVVSHGGGTKGQISLLTLVPERKLAVAVFTNSSSGGFVTRDVTKWVLKEYLGLDESDPEPMEASEEELQEFVGRYSRPMAEVELGLLCGQLVGQLVYKQGFPSRDVPPLPPPPPARLALCEKDRLLVLDGPMKDSLGDIIRNADGSIGRLRIGGRIHRRLT
jgi:hypothetical protein